jgi:metal-sulfur cluster biosynthetic enzyme
MTEFEEKVLENLVEIKKQQQQIIEILSKSIDMAIGDDTLNLDFIKDLR